MKKKYLYKILLGFFVTLLFLFLLSRLQRISVQELVDLFVSASPRFLLLGFLAVLAANLVRSLRFHYLLRCQGSFWGLFACNNLYNLTTATFPGGLGEIFSVFIFQRYNSLNTGTAFSLIVLSRLFDLLSLCLILLVALRHCSCSLARLLFLAALGLAIPSFLLLIPPVSRSLVALLNRLLPGHALFERPKAFLTQVEGALSCVRHTRQWLFLLFLSLVVMVLNILSLEMLVEAMGQRLSFSASAVTFGIYAVLQLLPVHGLGGVGTQEAWWTLGLTSVGLAREVAVPGSFFLHGMFYLYILLIALLFGFPWLRVRETKEEAPDGVFLSR